MQAAVANLPLSIAERQRLQSWSEDRTFKPHMSLEDRARILARWQKGVEAVRNYVLKI